jgi:hypothetical protein
MATPKLENKRLGHASRGKGDSRINQEISVSLSRIRITVFLSISTWKEIISLMHSMFPEPANQDKITKQIRA